MHASQPQRKNIHSYAVTLSSSLTHRDNDQDAINRLDACLKAHVDFDWLRCSKVIPEKKSGVIIELSTANVDKAFENMKMNYSPRRHEEHEEHEEHEDLKYVMISVRNKYANSW